MSLRAEIQRSFFCGAYVLSGAACTLFSLVCVLLFILPLPVGAKERISRSIIQRLCAFLVAYLRLFGILKADFSPLRQLGGRRGVIIAVNHPTFLDAILLMSQLSGVFCLTKAKLHRNPLIAAIVRSAGYEDNADANQLIANCSRRLQAGENLLVFPEGTRTSTPPVGKLKRGFALMAIRTNAPVVTILMTSFNGLYLRKGQPFFAFPPAFPIKYHLSCGEEFSSLPDEPSQDFCLKIESYFRSKLELQN